MDQAPDATGGQLPAGTRKDLRILSGPFSRPPLLSRPGAKPSPRIRRSSPLSKIKSRRQPVRRDRRSPTPRNLFNDVPIMAVIVAALLIIGLAAVAIYSSRNPTSSSGANSIDGVTCQSSEQLSVHYHAHLAIIDGGNTLALPAGIGIDDTHQCLYWIHTHNSDGIVHVEAPKSAATRKFNLGNLFDIWGKPLDATHVGATTLTKDQKLVVYVDGKTFNGNPRDVTMANHTQITLEITPPSVPPPAYTFPAGV